MKIHFIAIGGSIMHSLAIALQRAGHEVSGSDDQVYDPARTRLKEAGILSEKEGWHPERITRGLDAIILGMHAFEDNPELIRARELGVKMYSFPEFIYEHARNKQRVVIAGSYGKTTVTSMVMHVLEKVGKSFDYLVGAEVPGFDNSVRLSHDAPIIVVEGDEYLASRLDRRPKFLLYHAHMIAITGISWDHINVFPTEALYNAQFEALLDSLGKAGDVVYPAGDNHLARMVKDHTDEESQYLHPFPLPSYRVKEGVYQIKINGKTQAVSLIGKHNMANIATAWEVCRLLSVEIEQFLLHISTFVGAKSRLETVLESDNRLVIKDYAHAPAKVKATVEAVRERYKKQNMIACFELHTFSSLNADFLPHYKNSLKGANHKIVYVDPHALEKRRMAPITAAQVIKAFGDKKIVVVTSPESLQTAIRATITKGQDVFLMMSSGNFGGTDLTQVGVAVGEG